MEKKGKTKQKTSTQGICMTVVDHMMKILLSLDRFELNFRIDI